MKTQKDNTSTQDAKSTRELAMEYWGKLGVIRANELRSKYFPDYMLIDNEQIETIYLSEHPSTPPMEEDTGDLIDPDFLMSALNSFWHQANNALERKDLGDIERKNYFHSFI